MLTVLPPPNLSSLVRSTPGELSSAPAPEPRLRVWFHLLWAIVTLASVWSLGKDYTNGQVAASTAGAQAVWAQYQATLEFNREVVRQLNQKAPVPDQHERD